MLIDIDALRIRLRRWQQIIRPPVLGKTNYITPLEILQLIEEIERLRAHLEAVAGSPLSAAVLAWLVSSDTGISSRTIVAWMEREQLVLTMKRGDHPHDPADLGRCIRLLDIEPKYRDRIGEMAGLSSEWAALAAHWSELESLYREEEPTGHAAKCYARMKELIGY